MENVIVLFEVTVKDGKMEDYLRMAVSLREELSRADGFLRSERFSSLSVEGKLLSMSVWRDEASVAQWRKLVAHRMCQKHGRMEDFSDYTITVVTPVRSYTMTQRQGAPADSNSFLGV